MARDVPESGDRPADEIKITPEMIEAGYGAYVNHDPMFFTIEEIIKSIYVAMVQTRRKEVRDLD